jgi:hypothetical protein
LTATQNIFSDFKVGNKLSCGRKKAEALAAKVLAPSSVTDFLETLKLVYLPWDKLNHMVCT